MQEIIKAQGGDPTISSNMLKPGKYQHSVLVTEKGIIKTVQIPNLTTIAKILGAPTLKRAGIYLEKKIGEKVDRHDILCTFYTDSQVNLKEAVDTLRNLNLFTIE
jgi:AMP phosphorylase